MKMKFKVEKEFEVVTILVEANVRYWEDSSIDGIDDTDGSLMPCRKGDAWCPIIDIETGVILNWEIGKTAEVHYKVCDDGGYWLLNKHGDKIAKLVDYYVPKFLDTVGDGFGDYIILNIEKNGKIKDWNFNHKIDKFEVIII